MTHDAEVIVVIILSTVLFIVLVIFIGALFWNFQKRQMQYLREKAALKAQYEQEILTSQLEVQNATLQQIGQELHDNIGQLLSVARINLNIVEDNVADADSQVYIKQTSELLDQSLTDLRALTKSLDGAFVDDFGLSESITQELQRLRRTRKFSTEIQLVGTVFSLGFQREIVLFRIVQEALTNAMKHSAATQILATLTYDTAFFALRLTDNGKGFDYAAISRNSLTKSGAGLRNMQRRAKLIGATCDITSAPAEGTTLFITLPLTSLTTIR